MTRQMERPVFRMERPVFRPAVWSALLGVFAMVAAVVTLGASQAAEEIARRQLESGRQFARQGKYKEALIDFRAVAETHAGTSVADNALLEIARYYLDIEGDQREAQTAVDLILRKYATSDSAPDAHVLMGRLALARGHSLTEVDTALASFDRVLTLFPSSDAVPRALVLSGETLWLAGRPDDALQKLGTVQVDYSSHESAADAYLAAGQVLLSLGDPILAMEEMQQARNRFPSSPAAAMALSRIALLHRLYVRAKAGPAYAAAPDPVGPPRLENVVALAITPRQSVYYAAERSVAVATPATGEKPLTVQKPRGLAVDTNGHVYVHDGATLRAFAAANTLALQRPRAESAPEPLEEIEGIAQLSTGEWLASDPGSRTIYKFSRAGDFGGAWTQAKVTRLAINGVDQVAAIDRDQKAIVFFNAAGKITDRLPLKGTGYVFENPVDLTYDAFGHFYILDRESVGVFSPYPAAKGAPAPAAGGPKYRLVTLYQDLVEKSPSSFRRATAFAVDQAGALYLADDRAQKIRVYR
jgi:TolA-binding protein